MLCVALCSLTNIFLGWDTHRATDIEPEAASLYCQKVPDDHLSFGTSHLIRSPGVQYLVADIGGTYNIHVHCLTRTVYLI